MSLARLSWCLFAILSWASVEVACRAAESEDDLFATPKVIQIKIEVPQPQFEALRKDPKTYVKSIVREGDKAYKDVGLRLKGAASVYMIDKKPSLTLKFNESETGQYFHGHSRISLDGSVQDPSYLLEVMGSEIFRAAGVPATKFTFARIELNGRDLGLYVVTLPLGRDLLSDHFKKTKGNFYEGDKCDITERLRLDTDKGKAAQDQADLRRLADAARDGDAGQRMRKLSAAMDMERFLSFMAAEVFVWNRKGYVLEHGDYRVYHDPLSDRLFFMPGDIGGLFDKTNGPLAPECKGVVARGVLTAPDGQRLYRERMAKLLGTAFKVETLHARIAELAGKIRPVAARDANDGRAFDLAVNRLRETIAQRAKFLEEELKKPAK